MCIIGDGVYDGEYEVLWGCVCVYVYEGEERRISVTTKSR